MEFTSEIKKSTISIYNKVSKKIPEIEWALHAPYIYKINKLKKEKNAIILAHNYQTPEIYHGISDFSADSLALAIEDDKTKSFFADINYKVSTGPQYYVGDVNSIIESKIIDSIYKNNLDKSFLIKNQIFRTKNFEFERDRLNRLFISFWTSSQLKKPSVSVGT